MTWKNPFDRFTSTDELLRELIKQQTITNRLLQQNIEATRSGTAVSGGTLSSTALSLMSSGDKYETYIQYVPNKTIDTNTAGQTEYVFLRAAHPGIVSEIYFLSVLAQGTAYSVKVLSDDRIIYDGTWTVFSGRNAYEADIAAFADATYNVLSFQDVAFNRKLEVIFYGTTNMTFAHMYAKVHKRL